MPNSNSKRRLTDQEKLRRKNARIREKLRQQARNEKQLAKIIASERREADRKLVKTLRQASGKGIYDPKEFTLTKYRRSRARKISQQFGDMLDPAKYFFVKLPKKVRKEGISKAASLEISTIRKEGEKAPASKTGLFIPKKNYKRARVTVDKKTGEIGITKSGKTKRGPNKGTIYSEHIPLVSIDELAKEKQRLIDMAKRLGPLKGNEVLAFVVTENGASGYSRNVFGDIDFLMADLEKYNMNLAGRVQFYRHISVVKSKSGQQWRIDHPPTDIGYRGKAARRKMNIKGRN